MVVRNFSDKQVLNLGANTDPAGLKVLFGNRIHNADFITKDIVLDEQLILDYNFDATKLPWPLEDNSFGLIVLGDILEHLEEKDIPAVISESARVSQNLCITVPNDDRLGPGWNADGSRLPESEWVTEPGSYHITQVTEEKLRSWLKPLWEIDEWKTVHYHFTEEGYFVTAHRKSS
jgi:hypothetical protein